MGILGELSQMVINGQVDKFCAYLNEELDSCGYHYYDISDIRENSPRVIGAQQRQLHHNDAISFASVR